MERVFIHGKMEENIKVNIRIIRNMGLEVTLMKMEKCDKTKNLFLILVIEDFGSMACSKEKAKLFFKINKKKRDYGKEEKE